MSPIEMVLTKCAFCQSIKKCTTNTGGELR